jgi:Ca2+-binding RTX toxin-like protein
MDALKARLKGLQLTVQAIDSQVAPLRALPGAGKYFKRAHTVLKQMDEVLGHARSGADLATAEKLLREVVKIYVAGLVSSAFIEKGAEFGGAATAALSLETGPGAIPATIGGAVLGGTLGYGFSVGLTEAEYPGLGGKTVSDYLVERAWDKLQQGTLNLDSLEDQIFEDVVKPNLGKLKDYAIQRLEDKFGIDLTPPSIGDYFTHKPSSTSVAQRNLRNFSFTNPNNGKRYVGRAVWGQYAAPAPETPTEVEEVVIVASRPVYIQNGVIVDNNGAPIDIASKGFYFVSGEDGTENGDIKSIQDAQSQSISFAQIGSILGSNFAKLLDIEDPWAALGTSTLLGVIGSEIGSIIDAGGTRLAFKDALDNFGTDLRDAGLGAVSSYLFAELVNEIGIGGVPGQVLNTVGGAAIGKIAENLVKIASGSNISALAGVGDAMKGAGGAFVGTWLASKFVKFDTIGGQIGSSVGSSIGAIVVAAHLTAESVLFGVKLGAWAGPIGAAVGAFVGYIVGGLIGSLFGGTPKAEASLGWDGEAGLFTVTSAWSSKGGSASAARGIGSSVTSALNLVVDGSGASLLHPESVRLGSYRIKGSNFQYRATGGADFGKITFQTKNADDLINHGTFIALADMVQVLAGGNNYIKRAVVSLLGVGAGDSVPNGSVNSTFDLSALAGNIAVAKGYGDYLANREAIDTLISSNPHSSFAAGWVATLAAALDLNLDKRAFTDWVGGWNFFIDNAMTGTPTPANVWLALDDTDGERLFGFLSGTGELQGLYGDTIDTASKSKITGTSSSDIITVSNDTLTSTAGLTINGAAPTATTYKIPVAALIDAGAGDDIIRAGDLGNDVLGGAGNDKIVGGKLDDWLFGDDGDDVLFSGDVVGAGVVTPAQLAQANSAFTVNAATATAVDGGNGDLLDGGAGNDRLYGGKGSDWLKGGDGVDALYGGAGGDILEGGAGDDQGVSGAAAILGGAGTDQYVFGYGDGNDVIFDESDPAGVAGSSGDSLNTRISQLNAGTLTRNWAGGGSYEVDGSVKGGEDAVVFGAGVTMQNLVMKRSGANSQDLVIQLTADDPAGTLVNGHVQQVLTGDTLTIKDWFESTRKVEWLRFANGDEIRIADITSYVIGVAGGSVILGTNGADWIVGSDGDDKIFGLNGDDFGFGGLGNDLVSGDGNNDLVSGGAGEDVVIGGAGNDTVLGDGGADRTMGGLGNDILAGGRGDDVVIAGAGNDVIRYARGDGADVLIDDLVDNWDLVWQNGAYVNGYVLNATGGTVTKDGVVYFDGSKWIDGFNYDYDDATKTLKRHKGAVNGVISANVGTDTLEFAVGVDIQDLMLRRVGNDLELVVSDVDTTAGFAGAADKITVKDWWSAAGAELKPIEKFSFAATGSQFLNSSTIATGATDGADILTGVATNNWMTGGGGDDVITGGAGQDILSGGEGADTLNGGSATDYLYGGAGDDVIDGGGGSDQIFGGSGTDIVSFATSSAGGAVRAYIGNAWANGGLGVGDVYNSIEGIEGGSASDRLGGDAGDNILRGLAGYDRTWGGMGDDTYEWSRGDGGNEIWEGNYVVEEILDSAGVLNAAFTATWEYLAYGVPSGQSTSYYQYRLTVRRNSDSQVVYKSRDGVDFLYTTTQAAIPGGSAWPYANSQWVTGAVRWGNGSQTTLERIVAGAGGNDTLLLGPTISLSDLTMNRDGGLNIILSATDNIKIYNPQIADRAVETMQFSDGLAVDLTAVRLGAEAATAGVDLMIGDGGANTLAGLAGDDVLSGGAGVDNLDGGAGNDVLEGGTGGDTLNGGTDSQTDGLAVSASDPGSYGDTARYVTSVAAVAIDLAARTASGGDAEGDTIVAVNGVSTIENLVGSDAYGDQLAGDSRANRLFGLGGADTLSGQAGDDVLVGGGGDDTLYGGDGDDALAGEDGVDRLEGGLGKDLLSGGAGNDTLLGQAGDDQLTGDDGDDTLYGGDGLDTLGGGAGADILYGEVGDDRLVGGAGGDQLFGGDGNDILVGEAGDDTLTGGTGDDIYGFDANSGADRIIDASGINRITLSGVTSDRVWLTRSGEDLKVAVIGGDTAITLVGFYRNFANSPTRIKEIALDGASLFLNHAFLLVDAMTLASATTPAAMPAAIAAQAAPLWHAGGKAAPVVAAQTLVTNEDTAISGQVGALDDDDNITAYAVVGAPTLGALSLDAATGAWTYTPTANAHGDERFVISVTDADGQVVQQTVALTVTSVNDTPGSLTAPTTLKIDENSANGVSLGQFTSTDPDGPAETAIYSLSNDAAGRFEITSTGQLKVKNGAALNYEAATNHVVRVRVTDAAGAWLEKDFTVTVGNVNEAPNLAAKASQPITLASENANDVGPALGGATIATFNLTDPDNTTPTLRIASDPKGWLQVVGNAIQFKTGLALDFETLAAGATLVDTDGDGIKEYVYTFKVDAWDGALASASQTTLSVNIEDANDAPTNVAFAPSVASVAERDRPASGATSPFISLGTLSATDPDTTAGSNYATFKYSVDDPRFEIVNGNELRLAAGAALDYEAGATVSLSITVKDLGGLAGALSFTKTFNLTVTNQDDYLYGDANANTLTGQANRDLLYGYGGVDVLSGGTGDDDLYGGDGDDTLNGDAGVDLLNGDLGADTLNGGAGVDTLYGGDGVDILSGGSENDTLYGEIGNDTLNGDAGDDLLDGGDGNDTLNGAAGNDRLVGGLADDVLDGGAGADRFLGGAGTDTLSYASATAGVIVNLATGGTGGDAAGDIFEDVLEKVVGSSFNDDLTGTAAADIIQGGAGNDTLAGNDGIDNLDGGVGDDTLRGGAGNDILMGGAGSDTMYGGGGDDVYLIDINSGADIIDAFDNTGGKDSIGYQKDTNNQNEILNSHLWFERPTGTTNLVISVVGTGVSTTILKWYDTTTGGNQKIGFIIAGDKYTVDAEGLVTLMAAQTKPTTAAAYVALHTNNAAFENQWRNFWYHNGAPTIGAIANQAVAEDGSVTLQVNVADDITPYANLTVTATAVNPSNTTLADTSLINAPTIGAPDASGNRTLTFTTKPNASGQTAVKITAVDPGGITSEKVFYVNIDPRADTPVVTQARPLAGTLDSGSLALDIQAALTDQDGSETLEIRISNLAAGLTLNKGTNLGGGVWSLTPAQLAGLALLGPSTWSADLTGASALTVTAIAKEQANGATASASATLNVPINARPTAISADRTITVNETTAESQVANGTLLAKFSRTDADNDAATYSLVDIGGGAGAGGRFAINASTGDLTLANTNLLNFEAAASHVIRVRVTDTGGLTYDKDFTVNVGNLNERPTIPGVASQPGTIRSEGFTDDLLVSTYSASDPDGTAPTFFDSFDPYDLFYVSGNQLRLRGERSVDFEPLKAQGNDWWRQITDVDGDGRQEVSIAVGVSSTDGALNSADQIFVWYRFEDVNDTPTDLWADRTLSVAENSANGTVVGVFSRADQDATDGATYSLINNTSPFAFSGSTLVVAGALNYEAATSYNLTVRVTDSYGAYYDEAFSVAVGNVNEAPTDLWPDRTLNFNENTAINSGIAWIVGADPDGGALSYSLLNDTGGRFAVRSDGLLMTGGTMLNYENGGGAYSLLVRATDAGGLTYDEWVTVSVNDVNETPWVSSGSFSVTENVAPGTYLGAVAAADPDTPGSANVNLRFSLSGTGSEKFSINNAGQIFSQGAFDYETQPHAYNLTVTVRDQGGSGLTASAGVTINVNDVVENFAPTISASMDYVSGIKFTQYYAVFSASDVDGPGPISWAITQSSASSGYLPPVGNWTGSGNTRRLEIGMSNNEDGETISETSGYFTVRVTDAANAYKDYTYSVSGLSFNLIAPIVLDLDGDGVSLVSLAQSTVGFDQDGDGRRDRTGWAGPGDGLLVLDRNHNGLIDNGSEISFTGDVENAVSDLEGLRAYDTNENGFFDRLDADFARFQVWRDANQDGVSQADELFSLDELQITAINLTRSPNAAQQQPNENYLYGTTQFTRTDGTVGQVGDVMLAYQGAPTITLVSSTPVPPETGLLPPVAIDLDGDGVELVSRTASKVRFDVAGDGRKARTGWVGADDAFLALDRNGDGKITTGAEISFVGDLDGAVSDLEGLRAFDTNANGFLDAGDERFAAFRVWQDRNQDGVSQAGELHGLGELGFKALNLTQQLTGASAAVTGDNVLYATSDLVKQDGTHLTLGDVMLAFDAAPAAPTDEAPTGASEPRPGANPEHLRPWDLKALLGRASENAPGVSDELAGVDRTAASTLWPPVGPSRSSAKPSSAGSHAGPAAEPVDDAAVAPLYEALSPRTRSEIDLSGILDAAYRAPSGVAPVDYGELAGGDTRSAVDAGLALAQQTRLQMIQAMAGFSREGAADFGPDALRRGHAQSLALLTALPDIRVR